MNFLLWLFNQANMSEFYVLDIFVVTFLMSEDLMKCISHVC